MGGGVQELDGDISVILYVIYWSNRRGLLSNFGFSISNPQILT